MGSSNSRQNNNNQQQLQLNNRNGVHGVQQLVQQQLPRGQSRLHSNKKQQENLTLTTTTQQLDDDGEEKGYNYQSFKLDSFGDNSYSTSVNKGGAEAEAASSRAVKYGRRKLDLERDEKRKSTALSLPNLVEGQETAVVYNKKKSEDSGFAVLSSEDEEVEILRLNRNLKTKKNNYRGSDSGLGTPSSFNQDQDDFNNNQNNNSNSQRSFKLHNFRSSMSGECGEK